jgi:hypothetical protein
VTAIRIVIPLLFCVNAGCSTDLPARQDDAESALDELGARFDPRRCGSVTGRVTWSSPIPNPPGFLYGVPRSSGPGFEFRTAENPNRPQVDEKSRAVQGAVVFLREVDPALARPWNLPPVMVEMGSERINVIQGETRGRVGFVRRGDAITVSSSEARHHVLRGRGDAFFGLQLPEPNKPVARKLTKTGRVELTSGSGLYWANADLFVSDHPYFTLTDCDGRFALDRVPSGRLELVVWMPGWKPAKTERDPDSNQVARQSYSPPIERAGTVEVRASESTEANVALP